MLRMKRNLLIRGASFAVAVALLAGCQTGQKTSAVSFAEKFPDYGNDIEETASTDEGRMPASIVGPMKEFLKAISNPVTVAKEAKYTVQRMQTEFLSHVRKSPEGLALKKELGGKRELTLKDLEEFNDVKTEARLIESFMEARSGVFKKNGSLVAQTDVIIKKANEGLQYHQNSGGKGLLTSRGKGSLKYDGNIYEVKKGKIDLDEVFNPMTTREEFKTAEGVAEIAKTKQLVGEFHALTGRSYFIRETCDNLDLAALKSYNEMMDKLLKQMNERVPGGNGKIFAKCKNLAQIEAVVIANFQATLQREGRMAWVAVQEMGVCKYVRDDVSKVAGNKLASSSADVVEKTPTCQ